MSQRLSNIAKYFRKVTGLTPTPEQVRVLDAIIKEDKILISAGRGCGKSLTLAVATAYLSEEKTSNILLIYGGETSWILYYLRQIFRDNEELADSLVSKSPRFVIPNTGYSTLSGSNVFVRGGTERAIRGAHVDTLIIDEAALVSNDSILVALGCLTGKKPKIILLSTPTPEREHLFNQWLVEPEPEYKIHSWGSENLPWNSSLVIETQRKHYTPALLATEVEGRVPTDEELARSGKIRLAAFICPAIDCPF